MSTRVASRRISVRDLSKSKEQPIVCLTASAIPDAGAFALVIEGTCEAAARSITQAVPVPTIGIGAWPACDGQILVTDDLLGSFSEFTPRFVKRYAELGPLIADAVAAYAADASAPRRPKSSAGAGRP